ncbi:hypothetical protein ACLKMH_17415 [Psychromonas sp. KJ10-10]|uniref:hypothetical protein n=1 Tax=Psychromonas sp. KJ10-10 TaxID=3391823 RepID=UPI0039B521FD
MCGIIVTNNHVLENELTSWVYKLKHRGPDGISYYQNENVRMAFSRLAINDPSELGMQPIVTDECISMINGEIYNHKEIRDRYKLKYSGDADTNVVGPFYEVLKENIINHMDGFYSGIIFDKQTQKLLTLRDYLGKKGLFIVKSGKK